jgi:ketosteroid isomerase-like protein
VSREAPPLDVFKRGYLQTTEAFNHHDLEAAFAGLPADLEWRTLADAPGAGVARGPQGLIRGFRTLFEEFPDWQVHPQEFIDADPAILVRNIGTATGHQSGVPVRQEFTQVWSFRGGRPVRVDEYADHAEARRAADLQR